jgi:nucleoside 2-deoxyribosyltransferase
MDMKGVTIYWAGRLFNQAERMWNRQCAKKMREKGYTVILPQEDAEQFRQSDGSLDLDGLALACGMASLNCDVGIYNLDGPDVDSGTAKEAGIKVGKKLLMNVGLAIGVRTDFRAMHEDPKNGVNAMFRLLDDIVLYLDDDEEVDGLCEAIDARIRQLMSRTA